MFKEILVRSLNGFSVKDIPFLLFQLSVSAVLVWIIRHYWKKGELAKEESSFLNFLIPAQIVMTTLAIFSHQSPWALVLFGFLTLIPVLGNNGFSMRSKVFYLICIFVAFGCGSANLAVTGLITVFLILPVLHFYKSEN